MKWFLRGSGFPRWLVLMWAIVILWDGAHRHHWIVVASWFAAIVAILWSWHLADRPDPPRSARRQQL